MHGAGFRPTPLPILRFLSPAFILRSKLLLGSVLVFAAITCLGGCNPSGPTSNNEPIRKVTVTTTGSSCLVRRDLAADENAGGHSLRKHISRTDDQLRERLDRERNISGSSTYTDLDTAECAVGTALAEDSGKIALWANRDGGHSNFVVDYDAPAAIGRTLNRGQDAPHPCNHAKLVLAWDGPGTYHVLTTYPECR